MDYVTGIDVSVWQDNNSTPQQINFVKAYESGARFVFIKASQALYADQDILYNWSSSINAGLLRGAYHFLVWDVKPEKQAQFFYGLTKNDPGELPAVVDYEWWSTVPSNAINILWAFCVEYKKLSGELPILYTAPGFWQPYGQINSGWADFKLWIADYGANIASKPKACPTVPKPWKDWLFWQYSSKGDGKAYGCESASVDMNFFNGTEDDLYAKFGTPHHKPTNPDPVTPTPPTPPVQEIVGAKAKVLVPALNIRSGASTKYPIVGQLNQEDIVEIFDISGNDAWIQIGKDKFVCVRQGIYKFVGIVK